MHDLQYQDRGKTFFNRKGNEKNHEAIRHLGLTLAPFLNQTRTCYRYSVWRGLQTEDLKTHV